MRIARWLAVFCLAGCARREIQAGHGLSLDPVTQTISLRSEPQAAVSSTLSIESAVPKPSGSVSVEMGQITVPHAGSGTVTALLTGTVSLHCAQPPCSPSLEIAICNEVRPGDDPCVGGDLFRSFATWLVGQGEPLASTTAIALTHSRRVEGPGSTTLHLFGRANVDADLRGQVTVLFSPGPQFEATLTGLRDH